MKKSMEEVKALVETLTSRMLEDDGPAYTIGYLKETLASVLTWSTDEGHQKFELSILQHALDKYPEVPPVDE